MGRSYSLMELNRFWKADLSLPPWGVCSFQHHLTPHRLSWTQDPVRWLLMFYLHSGSLSVGSRVFHYEKGSLAIIPPGARAGHDQVGEGLELYWMEFELRGTAGPSVSLPLLSLVHDADWMIEEIESARDTVGKTHAQITSILWATLWRAARPASFYREFEELYEAEKHILDHLDQPLRVGEVALAVGVSARTLLRMFRQAHGQTVEQYITGQRVETARRLLATTDQPIKAISSRVGIHTYQHFNRVIKESTGLSPNSYRLRAQQNR
jgi:AraC-like DNA-binding protein